MAAESGLRVSDALFAGLTADALIHSYRILYTSRRLDDREIILKRQNKIFFQVSGAGHEAIGAAAGLTLKAGFDWVYPYYRDRALCLTLGVTPEEMLLQAVGAARDPASGGRQMPSHWGHARLRIVSASSPTGTQFLQAVGCAEGCRLLGRGASEAEIVLVTGGDGSTSEGEFWEALNAACLGRLPVLFLIEDNGYAISVPIEAQTAGGSISRLVSGFPDLLTREVDGTEFLASCQAMADAAAYCRAGGGPALVHARVTRP
ncbi:MAG TPA: thiamine pyrophosphate-dependent dehydrogenase E1 component subunit alpha, partial [Bryobacterales bacterium]|nr:thiamine pyrophosphate-dependent dehydrogenase E1 component subunit alpha [Bryobacterales bacterium]